MTTRCSVFIATSLDGFIARGDGRIDWLEEANKAVPSGEDCGYGQFMADVDALAMGRNTFEQVLAFDSWPYGSTPVVVMSRREIALPPDLSPNIAVTNETPTAMCSPSSIPCRSSG